jgi:hypothetical protein
VIEWIAIILLHQWIIRRILLFIFHTAVFYLLFSLFVAIFVGLYLCNWKVILNALNIVQSDISYYVFVKERRKFSNLFPFYLVGYKSISLLIKRHHSSWSYANSCAISNILYAVYFSYYIVFMHRTLSKLPFWSWRSNLNDCTQLNLLFENSHLESESFCEQIIVFSDVIIIFRIIFSLKIDCVLTGDISSRKLLQVCFLFDRLLLNYAYWPRLILL